MANIIDGKAIAAALKEDLTVRVAKLTARGLKPGLAVIMVGDNPASDVYVKNKVAACAKVGIVSFEHRLPHNTTQDEVRQLILKLNTDPNTHGILLQLPVPDHINSDDLINSINPGKDVDGLHPLNIGRLVAGKPAFVPCTPQGSLMLIHSVKKNLAGLHAVVIGRSLLFGKPMAQLLLAENCTVTQAHSKTKDLPSLCRQADILVAAIGQQCMVKADWLKPGAIVIDVGISRLSSGKLAGDIDYDSAKNVAGYITPVPGGVGPMTIACLLANTLRAAEDTRPSA